MLPPGSQTASNIPLGERIGCGTFSEVFRATDPTTGAVTAVKRVT